MKKKNELSPAELSMLFANLKLIYHSGLPLSEGFEILSLNARDNDEKQNMLKLKEAADMGVSLSESMQELGSIPAYAISLLQIGESTGKMEETLAGLETYYEKRDQLSQSLRSSLMYPLAMMGMVFLVIVVLLTQAMPVFEQVFSQLGLTMSSVAQGLMDFGQAMSRYAMWIAGAIVLIAVVYFVMRATKGGSALLKKLFDTSIFTRKLSLRLSVQRFALAMSMMISSGIDSAVALNMARSLVDSDQAKEKLKLVEKEMEDGKSFHEAMQVSGLFPEASMTLLAMGARTGTDAEALEQIGQAITVDTERQMERWVSALEPTLVCIMCILVGMVLLSVMFPLMGVLTNL